MASRSLASLIAFASLLGLVVGTSAQAQPQAQAGATPPAEAKEKEREKAPADAEKSSTAPTKAKLEKATFGGGCFWCLEAVFERLIGVKSVVSGYAGGNVARPSYALVSTGLTGHAEVVQIFYDPEVVSFEKLLEVFWACHDPTTLNRQGPDSGTQYRSIILYHDEAQKKAAMKSYKDLTQAGVFGAPIVTELVPLKAFYAADSHHQDYFRKNRNAPYCQMYIAPKLQKLMHK